MPKVLKPGERYAGRRDDAAVLNCTLDTEAAELLRHYCRPGGKRLGAFIARLIYQHDAREQERKDTIRAIRHRPLR